MSLPIKAGQLTNDEMIEMMALKNAINFDPSTVCPTRMERFTELYVRSLKELHNR
jgi:hypothetical protein